MELSKAAESRRSIRAYKEHPVEREKVEEIIRLYRMHHHGKIHRQEDIML